MAVNLDKPHLWKADIEQSVDMYNDWFMKFAPKAFRETRLTTTNDVEATLRVTGNVRHVTADVLIEHPESLPALRMSTCPPLAVDRLIGLAAVSQNVVKCMEERRLPIRMDRRLLRAQLQKIAAIIQRMADPDILVWLSRGTEPKEAEVHRAATIIADRLCSAYANPIIRNAQEKRQLAAIKKWLEARGYREISVVDRVRFDAMRPGTFGFRMNVPVKLVDGVRSINIPIDATVKPKSQKSTDDMPLLIEAKSAGDFTNTNKRRKEEAAKMAQLTAAFGKHVRFVLFLCGYFDTGYLGYEAAEGIDWVWEHRIDDLARLGI